MMNFLSDLGDFSFLFHKKFNSPLKKTSPMNWFRTFFVILENKWNTLVNKYDSSKIFYRFFYPIILRVLNIKTYEMLPKLNENNFGCL